uniref:Patatin n=1 Tax=Tetradesmus obliquus TaxID=3088 RepID=A0A383WDF1_TETOB|eukprot:jgi/Sobl393_1/12565/SZX75192.1
MFRSRVLARSGNSGNGDAQPTHDASHEFQGYTDRIKDELADAGRLKKNLLISDVVSSDGNGEQLQWVDLVLAGGGLLGIAHVGFVCVLEEAGVRFRGIGGTSAGAINAVIVAASRKDDKGKFDPSQESWEKTLDILTHAKFESFQDGEGVKNSNALLKLALGASGEAKPSKLSLAWAVAKALPELPRIWQNRGLHPGNEFQDWVKKQLEDKGIENVAGLHEAMSLDRLSNKVHLREGVQRSAEELAGISRATLKLVASDISTQTKVVFPDMANLYYAKADDAHPSDFVRASMSVPLFFQPYEIPKLDIKIPKQLQSVQDAWKATGYPDKDDLTDTEKIARIPDKATFVDGGTLSNFPISLFDVKEKVPLLPTVGCQLGDVRAEVQPAGNPIELYKAMNNTSRHIGDYEYVIDNPMYKPLVATADTKGFGWLDFDMPEEKKKDLFQRGAAAGVKLLKKFQQNCTADGKPIAPGDDNWSKIKRARAARAGLVVPAAAPAPVSGR